MTTNLIENWEGKEHIEYVLLLNENNQLLGMAWIKKGLEDVCLLHNVEIKEKFRNKGYGKELMTHILNVVKSKNYKSVQLMVKENNLFAVRLYSSFGFKEIRRHYGEMSLTNILTMELIL